MTNSPKSMEYWYGVVTFVSFIAAILSRTEMSVSDKIMTTALISAVPWAVSFLSRKEEEKRTYEAEVAAKKEAAKKEQI